MKRKQFITWMIACSFGMTTGAFAQATEESTVEASVENAEEGGTTEQTHFRVQYSGDWVFYEENASSSDYGSNAYFGIPGTFGDEIGVTIRVDVNQPLDFAADMYEYGLNAYEAIVNDAYEKTEIGGINFYLGEDDYFFRYMGYDEDANLYASIVIDGDETDPRVEELLNGIEFSLKPYTKEKSLWYWEGEAYRPYETEQVQVGDFTVETTWLPLDTIYPTFDSGLSRIATTKDAYYLLVDGVVSKCQIEDDILTYKDDLEFDQDVDNIFSDSEGNIYATGYLDPLVKISGSDEENEMILDECHHLTMHPSGKKAADFTYGNVVTEHDLEAGTSEDHELEGVSSLSLLYMTQNYAAAELWTEEENMLKIYDADWNEILTYSKTDTQSDYYGYVTAFVETENGWIAFDSYAGKAIFGGFDGAIYGEVDVSDLFGVSYFCSVNDACTNPDGSVSVAITDEREDESCYETLIFNLSGF